MTYAKEEMAERVLSTLRAHQADLEQAGIRRLSLFGSVARGEAGPESDVDLAAELDPQARIGMLALTALAGRMAQWLGREVDLISEPVESPRLSARIEWDRRRAF